MRSRKTATRALVAAASLAAVAAAILAVAASAQPGQQRANHPVKPFHLTKNCMNYFGGIGEYCTVTSSNLPALADAKIFYMQEAGATSLDSDTILYAGSGNSATGHCSLDFSTGLGHCDIFDGTGTLAGLHASVTVSHISGYDWAWDGTYRFKN